ncbi:tautomerase family protein [Paenibacillus melissococcoides]|uniref:Tautomerase family protein n=1 Tax=Paenibacillus melissococcoides TaxID=2912268 RepID=A0ABM9G8L7_9BACL|nr:MULTISPECIES: tautomerase family protein [Paenibacillus]MEB9896603.1 tautomerase family protein [Bacillus cereus]CAH8248323.1 tautomerase family protein [Paenibacillus melissococcoides]CAH8717826.1 tautomerase family protein [Paenibacillus melissococcoides]CAH8719298.1 tautomerase family protein [Paenibacillus melissococcoides]GIO77124.1 putative tautomerase YolI [Paenibacillus dendritiformis]
MPLLRLDVIEGRNEQELRQLLDAAHEAMVEAFDVPHSDRYQIVHQHPAHEMIIEDTGLGFERTKNLVIISIVSKARTNDQKERLYSLLPERLESACGISPDDVMISITENGPADWSFGRGEAQFLTGKL